MDLSYLREFAIGGYEVTGPTKTSHWKYNKVCSENSKKLSQALRAAEKEKDPKKKKRAYQEALKTAKECKKLAQEIPDDTAIDVIFNCCVKPWYWFVLKYAGVIDKTGKRNSMDNMDSMSRDHAVASYDKMIKLINIKLEDL